MKTKMSGANINKLAEILELLYKGPPPFIDHDDLYSTIDSIPEGDLPWFSFAVRWDGKRREDNAEWKSKTYEVWCRNILDVMEAQLLNPDFKDEIDWAPKRVFHKRTGKRVWSNLMSGNWAWKQAVGT